MKKARHLFEQVVQFDNLRRSFFLAMKGCGRTRAACRFFYNLENELFRLQDQLVSKNFSPGPMRFFTIYDPKMRRIAVAPFRDRVVHHAVVSVLIPVYERVFIYDSYATRKGKGTHRVIERAARFAGRWDWCLKTDIEHFFDNVDHDILLKLLSRRIADQDILWLLERIARDSGVPRGLPIGNMTSQFMANVYLDPLDHYLKDELGCKGYIRYMDDFVVFSDSRDHLKEILRAMKSFLGQRLGLRLKERGTWINRCRMGLSFCGMRIYPRYIRVRAANRRRSLKKLEQTYLSFIQGGEDEEKFAHRAASVSAYLRYFTPGAPIPLGSRCRTMAGATG